MAASPSHPGKCDLQTICNALGGIEFKWFKIGIQLGIPHDKLMMFQGSPDPLSSVINYWLKNIAEPASSASWSSIVAVLKSKHVDEPGLAERISKSSCIQEETTPESDSIAESDYEEESNEEESNEEESMQDEQANGDDSSIVPSMPSPSNQQDKPDPKVARELKRVLSRKLKGIHNKYATYVNCLRVAVVEKKVSAKELRTFLLSISATSQSSEGERLTLLSDKEAQLKECNEVIDIFNLLTTECASFLNYDIFQRIQEHYGICNDEEVFKYPKHLKAYIKKHKISEFKRINPQLKHKIGSKKLILKYDIETTCRLAKLTDLKLSIADIMEISSLALEIVDIEDGCVIVTFFIPASIADALFTPDTVFTPQQEEKLRAASVLWMKCNGRKFHFNKQKPKDEALQKVLTCPICRGTYTNPKQLQCQHTYCQQCLVKVVKKDQQGQPTLTCPTCRQVTPVPASGVAGLQADFRANQLLEVIDEEWKEPILAKPPLIDADLVSEEIAEHKYTPPHCPNHNESLIEIFCRSCGKAICWKCSRDEHYGHDCEALTKAFIRCKEDIMSLLQAIDYALTKLETNCVEISDQQAAIEEEIHSTILIDDRKTELISQLHQLTQAKLKSLAAQRDQIETIQAQLNKHLNFIEDTSYQGETLQMKSITVKQVEELQATLYLDLLNPNRIADMIFSSDGVLYTKGSPDFSKCVITGVGYATVQKTYTTTLEVFNFDEWPCEVPMSTISGELVSEITNTTTTCKIEKKRHNQYKVSYKPYIKGRYQLHVRVEGEHIKGSPFLVSVRSQVEDLDTPMLTIRTVRKPGGIAVSKKGEMVVVDGKRHCITILNPRGEKIRSIGKQGFGDGQFGYPYGVALDGEDNIFVTDRDNKNIQKFTPQEEFLTSVDSEATPYGIAYNASNGWIYVVDYSSQIQVLDSNLSKIRTFGEQGSDEGQFLDPRHVACDSSGNVYVADRGTNHRIQVFTAEGKFIKIFGEREDDVKKIKDPYSITMTECISMTAKITTSPSILLKASW